MEDQHKMVRGQLVCLIYSQFLLVHGQIVIGRKVCGVLSS